MLPHRRGFVGAISEIFDRTPVPRHLELGRSTTAWKIYARCQQIWSLATSFISVSSTVVCLDPATVMPTDLPSWATGWFYLKLWGEQLADKSLRISPEASWSASDAEGRHVDQTAAGLDWADCLRVSRIPWKLELHCPGRLVSSGTGWGGPWVVFRAFLCPPFRIRPAHSHCDGQLPSRQRSSGGAGQEPVQFHPEIIRRRPLDGWLWGCAMSEPSTAGDAADPRTRHHRLHHQARRQ